MDLSQLITSHGFPIAACVGLAFFCQRLIREFRAESKEQRDNFKDALATVIDECRNERAQLFTALFPNFPKVNK
jgi:hypothetical protein